MRKGMLLISADSTSVRKLFEKLADDKDSKQALKKALNETAEQAVKELERKAQDTYTVKNKGFENAMKIKKATVNKTTAILHTAGEPLPITDFKISRTGEMVKAQILKDGSLKELQKGDLKAFVNNVADKKQKRKKTTKKGKKESAVRHYSVAQREGQERLPIKTLFSNSIPIMIGNGKKVYGLVEPHIGKNLRINLAKFIGEAIEGTARYDN